MDLPHGGNIYHYSRKYGVPQDRFLDFSASINPLGPPASAVKAMREAVKSLVSYPDPDSSLLLQALAGKHSVSKASLLAGNGSTELIYLLPRALKPAKVLIPAPTFSDYERAARLAGSRISFFRLKERDGFLPFMDGLRKALDGVDMFFLCNPNNPTGVLLGEDIVLDILMAARKAGTFAVVDEAFIEYAPGRSVIRKAAAMKGVAVLRNFTKFYGMPGLRAGYLAAHPSVIERLKAAKEPWSVNTPAERAAAAALTAGGYERKSISLVQKEKEYLYNGLEGIPGIKACPPSVNFVLARLTGGKLSVAGLCEDLASEGILIRPCSNFRGLDDRYFRLAVRTRPENDALLGALKKRLCFTQY